EGGRSGVIRTRDPLIPTQVRYQAALHSEALNPLALWGFRRKPRRDENGTSGIVWRQTARKVPSKFQRCSLGGPAPSAGLAAVGDIGGHFLVIGLQGVFSQLIVNRLACRRASSKTGKCLGEANLWMAGAIPNSRSTAQEWIHDYAQGRLSDRQPCQRLDQSQASFGAGAPRAA